MLQQSSENVIPINKAEPKNSKNRCQFAPCTRR